ncbi:MAG: hypothetical protein RLZZ221_2774, partial [Verrucomicrobiota bacterium]
MIRILAAAAFLSLFAHASEAATPWRILAVGDSITEGGASFSCYRPLLAYGSKILQDRILTGTSYPMQPLEQAYAEFGDLPLP